MQPTSQARPELSFRRRRAARTAGPSARWKAVNRALSGLVIAAAVTVGLHLGVTAPLLSPVDPAAAQVVAAPEVRPADGRADGGPGGRGGQDGPGGDRGGGR